MRRIWISLTLALACILQVTPAYSRERSEIKPPFNTYWGLPKDKLIATIKGAKGEIIETRKVKGREAITVEGLLFPKLQRVVFYFTENALSEVELQYGERFWDSSGYSDYFDNCRRTLENKYGVGRLITRTKKRDGATLITIIGYQWAQIGATLQLYYFSADKGADAFRVVSLHYRGS